MSASIARSDVQRIVLRGYGFDRVNHLLLTVKSAAAARAFMGSLAINDSEGEPGSSGLAVALTFRGLQALGLPAPYLSVFRKLARAFCEGAVARAAERLGDTGRNEPTFWDQPFQEAGGHVLLSVYADTQEQIDERLRQLRLSQPQDGGLSGWHAHIPGKHIGPKNARTEWFGFRDDIAQPTLKGLAGNVQNLPRMQVEPGEILLGYADEDQRNRWAAPEIPEEVRRFVKNGSFLALRKMQQHVELFHRVGTDLDKAKICGRWPNGAVVEPGQMQQPAEPPEHPNLFDFSRDPHGYGCPHGSHIRRLNPRTDQVVPSRKILLVRRGMPYQNGDEVGLLGMFVCSSLEGQFEFLQKQWVAEPPLNPHGDGFDPLIGHPQDPRASFHIPTADGVRAITGLAPFVTVKGTLYGFYPSIPALRMIARMP
jgi:deferrochelatase/peroxidase EfeB